MEEMRVYVANLGKYNEGELVGAWFEPPIDYEEMAERMNDFFVNLPDILTIDDLQAALRVGRSTAYKLIQDNQIPSFRIGKSIKVYKRSLVEYIEKALYNEGELIGSHSSEE